MSYIFRGMEIPPYMEEGIARYVEKGRLPGDFLYGVLMNDLRRAVDYADDLNIKVIPAYIGYFYNNVPSVCWGSTERVVEWVGRTQEEREEILKISEYKPIEDFR